MSSPTLTLEELSSELRPYEQKVWRIVEAQHYISTRKLVDNRAEQELLEDLIEKTKPAIPEECRDLDYLLSTPFRYGAVYPTGSRFRRAGRTLGVFYASEDASTAVAEMAFHRLLFFAESPTTPWPTNAADYTSFAVAVASLRSLDLFRPPLVRNRAIWTHPIENEPCQVFADVARAVEAEIIRYQSVRDPRHRANVALLKCTAFAKPKPIDLLTWRIRLSATGAQAFCESTREWIEFDRAAFANDPRIASISWER
jgi:hypothetical protein